MIKELIKIANRLDAMDLKVEADRIDGIIRRIASSGDSSHRGFGSGNYGIYHMSPVGGGVYTVTWFDTLEEAERELASGYYQIDGGGYPYIVRREKTNGMMSDDEYVDPFDDESEDPGDWSESKWREWNSQAGTF